MENAIKITGVKSTIRKLKKVGGDHVKDGRRRMTKACLYLRKASAKQCPKDTGHLVSTLFTRVEGKIRVKGIVGYSAIYAFRVHENPFSGRTGGFSPTGIKYKTHAAVGKWKYLEDPYKNNQRILKEIIAGKI